jgi:hypothetical protein
VNGPTLTIEGKDERRRELWYPAVEFCGTFADARIELPFSALAGGFGRARPIGISGGDRPMFMLAGGAGLCRRQDHHAETPVEGWAELSETAVRATGC